MQFLNSLASHSNQIRLRWKQACFLHRLSSSLKSASDTRLRLIDFLCDQGFLKSQAISFADRYPSVKSLERPRTVVQFLKNLGLSDSQIRSSIRVLPQIIFCDAKKTLEPKIRFLEELGFSGSALPNFLSKNSLIFSISLQRRLIPSAEIVKSILTPIDKNNKELVKVLCRCSWLLTKNPNLFLLPNISYLKGCGIFGSQLAFLLRNQPRLFLIPEERLRVYVSRALDLGFCVNSRMLVHALLAVSGVKEKTLNRKIKILKNHGYSEDEIREMIIRAPNLILCSEDKLRLGMEFYETVGLKREALIRRPILLIFSLEDRVIPRFKVMEVLREKGLLKKTYSCANIFQLSEKKFLEKFISRFGNETTLDLLVAYKGHLVDANHTSSTSSCSSDED